MKMLIPVDGSEPAQRAIDLAGRLAAGASPTEVVLLHVRNGPEYYGELAPLDYQAIERAQRESQQSILAKSLEHAQRIGLAKASVASAQGLTADEIVRAAREHGVDQILMGTHGRGAVGSLILGSVAQRVVHLAPMPVTLVK